MTKNVKKRREHAPLPDRVVRRVVRAAFGHVSPLAKTAGDRPATTIPSRCQILGFQTVLVAAQRADGHRTRTLAAPPDTQLSAWRWPAFGL